jgi:hypothetical protein
MTFVDWDYSGGEWTLDTTRQEGTASLLNTAPAHTTTTATRKNFTATQLQVVFYGRAEDSGVQLGVRLSTYGDLAFSLDAANTWYRFRATFWYDGSSNTKLGRKEKWDPSTSSWIKLGDDVNFGTGAPDSGTLSLIVINPYLGASKRAWFDDVYVYTT